MHIIDHAMGYSGIRTKNGRKDRKGTDKHASEGHEDVDHYHNFQLQTLSEKTL